MRSEISLCTVMDRSCQHRLPTGLRAEHHKSQRAIFVVVAFLVKTAALAWLALLERVMCPEACHPRRVLDVGVNGCVNVGGWIVALRSPPAPPSPGTPAG